MYVVDIIPFIRGAHVDSLTYYVADQYEPGTIVTVPIRKKEARGMIVSCQPVSKAKTAVRAATFSLRKLPEQKNSTTLPPVLIKTAKELCLRIPTTLGATLFSLLPPEVRDGTEELHAEPYTIDTPSLPEISVLQGLTEERYRVYRSRIREAFAHRGSVLFIVPTSADIDHAYEALTHGIEKRIAVFSPLFGTKKLSRAYEAFHDLSHAKLIITTPRHAFLDRHDITTIIIDNSRSQFYKSMTRPYFDTCMVMKTLARISGRSVILGDILPRTEDEYARRNDIYLTENEHPKRYTFESAFKCIVQKDTPTAEAPFTLFSKPLIKAVETTLAERKNVLLLAARRGLAPVVACGDCGYIFRCPDSGAPYSLFKTKRNGEEKRWFLSTTSGKRVRAEDTCPSCGSWRLKERGIGIQHIHSELPKYFRAPVILFDHTTATTYKKAQRLISEFYETKGALLLATPMVLPYLEKPVACSAIMSLDATRAIPSWRADEELLALIFSLRERTEKAVYVQSRSEHDTLIEHIARGQVDQFYTDEIALRKALLYPPFSVFILLTIVGSLDSIETQETEITSLLAPTNVTFYSAPQSTRTKTVRNGLIRLPREVWPDTELLQRLKELPPSIRIEVDPPRIV